MIFFSEKTQSYISLQGDYVVRRRGVSPQICSPTSGLKNDNGMKNAIWPGRTARPLTCSYCTYSQMYM